MNRAEVFDAASRCEMEAYARLDLVAVRGEGARLYDADGTRYLDLYGGHAVAILGHSPQRLADAIAVQARDLLFTSNAVHVPSRAAAAARLSKLAPWEDARVFFNNSGTEAIETALKIARQATGRRRTVSFRGGFHGRTLGALGACGLSHYRDAAARLLDPADAFRILPFDDAAALAEGIDGSCAAVLVEPIQSMGGVRVLSEEFAHALRKRCDETSALLVFDEIQTAPARTGFWFAGERWGVAPDLICTAKGIAGGFPAGVVLARPEIAATVRPGDQGTTFGGGPVACAAIDTTLSVLEEIDGPARARSIEARFREALSGRVPEVRGHGGLLGLRLESDAAATLRRLRTEARVLAGSCPGDAKVIRLFPPLTLTDAEIDEALDALGSVLS